MQIKYIGRETAHTQYSCDGLLRDDHGSIIFQYTTSGIGTLRIGQAVYSIHPGQGFLVSVPSDHEYYLDSSNNNRWEFIYITLQGGWAEHIFNSIIECVGHIVNIDKSSRTIKLLENSLDSLQQRKVKDVFDASVMAYTFLMELYKHAKDIIPEKHPLLVKRAMEMIKDKYQQLGGIENLAGLLNVDRAHLIREFSKNVGVSPGQYLIRTRLENAVILLQNTGDSLNKIAAQVGFANGNYLGKVLRQFLGMSTADYRKLRNVAHN